MKEEKSPPVIRTEGLTRKFGQLIAVDNLAIEAREGEIFGLLGPNGAGKTTTIKMICGLLKPDKGKIFIHNRDVADFRHSISRKIGLCPQELVLWEYLTCREQLLFTASMSGLAASDARNNADRLLKQLGLIEKCNKTARTLSGGLKRRLNVALALVHNPEIIILDEPEAGLDPQSRVMLREFIRSEGRGKTVIFTTHNMDEAERICDRVGIIDKGKLLVLDSPENLKHSIGEGDVLEISVQEEQSSVALEKILKQRLGAKLKNITRIGPRLLVHSLNTAKMLPEITSLMMTEKIALEDIRFRPNSLEDVFINLTGRSLRE